jgi:EAL domain-containing protein (putative c-di-GMP-specific phosphodiesterase class I)
MSQPPSRTTPSAPTESMIGEFASLPAGDVDDCVDGRGMRPVFQPIVSLEDGSTVGFEALARWTRLDDPCLEAVFAYAASTGHAHQLERTCIRAAIAHALRAQLDPGTPLFINCEATTPCLRRADDELLARGSDHLQLVFEITERSLLAHPQALLAKITALRADGFAVALDDVGAHLDSLAMLDVVAPDVIKLDLALVQSHPRYQQARAWAAILDHHERAGALILAEGIETTEHIQRARSLGATLGQGFLFGHPSPFDAHHPTRTAAALRIGTQRPLVDLESPFDVVAARAPRRVERKDTVLALSRYLEQQALQARDAPMVLAALQRREFFRGATRRVYHQLAAASPLVAVFGDGVSADLGAGVRGVSFTPDDPLAAQWIVLILGATNAAALVAREHDAGTHLLDADRRFDTVITNDRTLVTKVAHTLLSRMV